MQAEVFNEWITKDIKVSCKDKHGLYLTSNQTVKILTQVIK